MGKRQRHKQQPQKAMTPVAASPSEAPVRQPSLTADQRRAIASAYASSRGRASATWSELSQQYSHVNAELRQIGIIAGSFLVILLVLTAILG